MPDQPTRHEIIDSDGHVIEPDVVWREYAEPEFRELLDFPGGGGYVQATGIQRAYPDMPPEFLGTGGDDAEAAWESADWDEESKHKMSRPGGYDPVARLVDMDAEGIDVAVLYPTAMLTWIEEVDVFAAACRAYNNWLHDYCAVAPGRLYPVALVPLQDPQAAIVEMTRAFEHLGAKAVMIRPAPYIGELKLNDPAYDPFWAAAAALGCPIGVHPSPHGDMANSCRLLGLADGVSNPTEGLALRQGITNAFDLQMAVAYFTLGGICERHPALRVAFLEGTGGWIVPMLQRFDHQFEIFGSSDQTTRPSEVFARQCMVSFDPDEVALTFTAEHLGADKILWASDYPHPDAKIPGVVQELLDVVKPLPDESQRLIVGATARAFYDLLNPVRASIVVAVGLAAALASCSEGSHSGQSRSAPTTVTRAVTSTTVAPITSPDQLVAPTDASSTAAELTRVERALRTDGSDGPTRLALGWAQQLAYGALSAHPEWADHVLGALPDDVKPTVLTNHDAAAHLASPDLGAPPTALPEWTIRTPMPPAVLLGYYREAETQSGVPWPYLAAIHFVETRMGRIHGNSTAGAQGPMQFIASTWAAYGSGGDVNDDRDAIFAAGRFLADRGGSADIDRALFGYNPSDAYVAAIKGYASVIAADARAYDGYYAWQVYVTTSAGTQRLPEGWHNP